MLKLIFYFFLTIYWVHKYTLFATYNKLTFSLPTIHTYKTLYNYTKSQKLEINLYRRTLVNSGLIPLLDHLCDFPSLLAYQHIVELQNWHYFVSSEYNHLVSFLALFYSNISKRYFLENSIIDQFLDKSERFCYCGSFYHCFKARCGKLFSKHKCNVGHRSL